MNLLLLLSALLSALTGAASGVRVAQAPVAVARQAEVAAIVPAARVSAPRPSQPLPTLVALAWAEPLVAPLAPAAPLFLSRRRE